VLILGGINPEAAKKVFEHIDQLDVSPAAKTIAKSLVLIGANPTDFLIAAAYAEHTAASEQRNPRPEPPADYTETERVLHEMLTENTGAHPLDSGYIYGRHWEENRRVGDFRKLPVVEVDEDSVTINVFHYLRAFLERDELSKELERRLYEYADLPENERTPWLGVMEGFVEDILAEEGWEDLGSFNTYNWENLLSQVLQGIIVEHDDYGRYVILQIHNGCDVRGGYTQPRIFRLLEDDDGDFLFFMDEYAAWCKCTRAYSNGGDWDCHSDDDGRPDEFPEYWRWDGGRYVCDRCGVAVEFHSPVEDYL
jgi:hypothetical protein